VTRTIPERASDIIAEEVEKFRRVCMDERSYYPPEQRELIEKTGAQLVAFFEGVSTITAAALRQITAPVSVVFGGHQFTIQPKKPRAKQRK
jgi:hypothetical protein